MALNLAARVIPYRHCSMLKKASQRFYSIYEPDYLHLYKPSIPSYVTLNIQIKGYMYPVLESYQSFITKLVKQLELDVDDSYAFPHKDYSVTRYMHNSTTVESQFTLKMYERDTQLSNVPSVKFPVLLRLLDASLPAGVSMNVDVFDPEYDKKRYIPDTTLNTLQGELDALKAPKK